MAFLSGLLAKRPVPHHHRPSTAPTGQIDQQICEQRQLFQRFYSVLEIVKSVRFESLPATVQFFVPVWRTQNINASCYYFYAIILNINIIIITKVINIIKTVNKTYAGAWLMYREYCYNHHPRGHIYILLVQTTQKVIIMLT